MEPLFGKTFDLDGDGHVSPEEELFGYTMMRRQQEEQKTTESGQMSSGIQDYSEEYSNSDFDVESWPDVKPEIPNTSEEYYSCGLLSYQSFSGFPCSKTVTLGGTKNGYVKTALGSYKYEVATRESFNDYISYIKSKGALVHDYDNDQDLGYTSYTFFFTSEGKVWILDVICQWEYGCDVEVRISGGSDAATSEDNSSQRYDTNCLDNRPSSHDDSIKRVERVAEKSPRTNNELMNPQGITEYLKQVLDLESTLFRLKTIKAEATSKLQYKEPEKIVPPAPKKSYVAAPPTPPKEESGADPMIQVPAILAAIFFIGGQLVYSTFVWWATLIAAIIIGAGIWQRKIDSDKYTKAYDEYKKRKAEHEQREAKADIDFRQKMSEYNDLLIKVDRRHEEAVAQAQKTYRSACNEVNKLDGPIRAVSNTLTEMYSQNLIFPKYHTLPAIASFYEYFVTGRCSELSGPNGAYNLYESELRHNLILDKLDLILSKPDSIRQNQYVLYEEVRKTAQVLPQISLEVQRMVNATTEISSSTAIASQCAEAAAKNSEALKYLAYIK